MLLGRYFHSGHCISCYSLPLNSTKKFFRFLRLEQRNRKVPLVVLYHETEIIAYCAPKLAFRLFTLGFGEADNSQTDKTDYSSHFVMVILLQCCYSVQQISTGQAFSLECGTFSDFPLPRNIQYSVHYFYIKYNVYFKSNGNLNNTKTFWKP